MGLVCHGQSVGREMPTDLIRAQHYRELAQKLHDTAVNEPDEKRRVDLQDLANQYEKLTEKLVAKIATARSPPGPPTSV
jgi:hypothetical protein